MICNICPGMGLVCVNCPHWVGHKRDRERKVEEVLHRCRDNIVEAVNSKDNQKMTKTEREIELEKKLEIAVKAIKLARDTAYAETQDCPKCVFIDNLLSKTLKEIKEC